MAAMRETAPRPVALRSPFDLDDEAGYRAWRDEKLAAQPASLDELIVPVADPRALSAAERSALLQHCARSNLALYRSPVHDDDPQLLRRLGLQLGLRRLDANWLAGDDGLSRITVASAPPVDASSAGAEGRGGFIPYTDRALQWHTDGYYHPPSRRIRAMCLHCVRPARSGGETALIDPELAYIALRDASPRALRALMAPDAMTIPARADDGGVARAAQTGPVFSVDPGDGQLHMRYTARTRSIEWKADAATAEAVAWLAQWLAGSLAGSVAWRVRLMPGMGLVSHNVLHDRSAFVDDPAAPRLLYRARYLDRVDRPAPWPNG